MESRLLLKAARLALGPGRPPPSGIPGGTRALHTGHRPAPTTLWGRLLQRVLPRAAHAPPPSASTQPFAFRGAHTYRANLSLPARQFMRENAAKSFHSIPRPPSVSRGVQQVGLGKARSFSTASPLFHTVKNVPIVLRAFAQADLDLKNSVTDAKLKATAKGKGAGKRSRALNRLRADNLSVSTASHAEFDQYFATETPAVLTQVTISLEPVSGPTTTPGSPGSPGGSHLDDEAFWQSLSDIHSLYRPHMKRVDAVLRRLEPYASLRRNEDVIGWSPMDDDGDGLARAVRFAYAASPWEVRGWLGDYAAAKWLTVEDITVASVREGVFGSVNSEMDRVWNQGSIFPDPIAPTGNNTLPLADSLAALPEWGTGTLSPAHSFVALALSASGASTPPDYFTDPSEMWTSGFGSPGSAYDAGEEDVLSEPDSVGSWMGAQPQPPLQFSAEWERRSESVRA